MILFKPQNYEILANWLEGNRGREVKPFWVLLKNGNLKDKTFYFELFVLHLF